MESEFPEEVKMNVSGSKWDEVKWNWKIHNEIHNLYFLFNILKMIKPRRSKRVQRVT
jgi:hypothetical protein